MAKTKTVKAWAVFEKDGELSYTFAIFNNRRDRRIHLIAVTKASAEGWKRDSVSETVRPVTVSWEVEK